MCVCVYMCAHSSNSRTSDWNQEWWFITIKSPHRLKDKAYLFNLIVTSWRWGWDKWSKRPCHPRANPTRRGHRQVGEGEPTKSKSRGLPLLLISDICLLKVEFCNLSSCSQGFVLFPTISCCLEHSWFTACALSKCLSCLINTPWSKYYDNDFKD